MKTDKIKKNTTPLKPLEMPTVETTWVGIPPLSLSSDSTDEMPILYIR